MGRPPFPNPAPTKTLQLRRCQGAALRIPSRKHRDLLRRKQASSCGLTRGCHFHRAVKVTFSRCYNSIAKFQRGSALRRLKPATRDKLEATQIPEESTLSDHKQEQAFRVIDPLPSTAHADSPTQLVQ